MRSGDSRSSSRSGGAATLRKLAFAAAVVAGSAGVAASCWAFFTTTGTGVGSASTGTASLSYITISPTSSTVVVGQSASYSVTAVNNFGGQTDVTSSATLSIQNGSCTGNSCTSTAVGAQTVTAAYSGKTATATQTVSKASTTASVVSTTGSPSVVGQQVTYTATVTVTAPGTGTPTGNVEFFDGGTPVAACGGSSGNAMSGSTATCQVTYAATGSHSITAQYLGDSRYLASAASSAITQTVNKDATTTTVSESPTSVFYGSESSVVFTAGVSTQHGEAVPNGDTITVSVNAGAATCTITLPATTCSIGNTAVGAGGPYAVSATFNGDSNLLTSTGNASTGLTVQATTATSVVSTTGSPSVVNQPVTYTATVTSGGGTPPSSDTVTFKDGGNAISCGGGSSSFNGTTATCVVTYGSIAGSPHSITAVFGGDAIYTTSTSPATSQTVNAFGTATKLGFIQQPTNAFTSTAITPAVTVAVEDNYSNVVTTNSSTVTLAMASGAGTLTGGGAVAASSGVATYSSLSVSAVGAHTLSATGSFTSATSSTFYIYSATLTTSKQANTQAVTTANFTALANTAYLVFVSETGVQSGNPTMTSTFGNGLTLSSSPVASNFASSQGGNEWVYTATGATASGSGAIKATFAATPSRGYVWIVQLGGANVTNPVVTSNARAATGTSTGTAQSNSVTLPSAPAAGDAGMLFTHVAATDATVPIVAPAMTNTGTWASNPNGAAGVWFVPTAAQNEAVSNIPTGDVWFALAIEIAHV